MSDYAQWQKSREVVARVVITGVLVLDTPASLGNGDADGVTDIPLLRDPLEGKPLLTGASIAGALRNYLREFDGGYCAAEHPRREDKSRAEKLFGHLDDSDPDRKASVESWLMVDDAVGKAPADLAIELRDGVSIDPQTRTAREKQKYNMALLAAGTTFPLRFELWLTAEQQASGELLGALVDALGGLTPVQHEGMPAQLSGVIGLGARKRRGLGACHGAGWQSVVYDMRTPAGLLGWLREDTANAVVGLPAPGGGQDRRVALEVVAKFELVGSLLIRAETGAANAPDTVHLRSVRNGALAPVTPGTSVGGVLRGRALRIANTMLGNEKGRLLVDAMFGRAITGAMDQPAGSLVTVRETIVEGGIQDLVQNRVKIDRFTSGAYPAALFSEEPLWSGETEARAQVLVEFALRRPAKQAQADFEAAAGLLLLVLKDLWTGDLALGGESSVGRGRLQGRQAWLRHAGDGWTLAAAGEGSVALSGSAVSAENRLLLEGWVNAFNQWAGPAKQEEQSEERKP